MSEGVVKGPGSIYSETVPDPGDLGPVTVDESVLTSESDGADNKEVVDSFVENLEIGKRDKSVSDKILGAYFKYINEKSDSSTDDDTNENSSNAIIFDNYAKLSKVEDQAKALSNEVNDLNMALDSLKEMQDRHAAEYVRLITASQFKASDEVKMMLQETRKVLEVIEKRKATNTEKLFQAKGQQKKVDYELITLHRSIIQEQLVRSKETSPLKSVLANYEQYIDGSFKLKDDDAEKVKSALESYLTPSGMQKNFLLNGLILNLYNNNSEESKFIQGLSDTFNSELEYVKKSINESIDVLPQEKSNIISRKLMETLTNINNIVVSKGNPMIAELRFLDKLIKAGFNPGDWTDIFGVTASGAIKRILDTWITKKSALTYIDLQNIFYPTVITPSIYIDTMTLEASATEKSKEIIMKDLGDIIDSELE
uniref:Uncharacterized protein n=1 Tax=viral metagenome TaxID=1070528 RepID=A0A2V0RLH9_9ZZZZ